MESDDGEEDDRDTQPSGRADYQLGVGGKDADYSFWKEFTDKESTRGDACSTEDGEFQYLVTARIEPGSEVIARNGLHTLVESHNYHHHYKGQSVNNAISTDGQVAAMSLESLVNQNDDETGGGIHQEGGEADGQ